MPWFVARRASFSDRAEGALVHLGALSPAHEVEDRRCRAPLGVCNLYWEIISGIFVAYRVRAETLITAANAMGVKKMARAVNNIMIQLSLSPDRLNFCSVGGC